MTAPTTTDWDFRSARVVAHLERGIVTLHEACHSIAAILETNQCVARMNLRRDYPELVPDVQVTTRGIPAELRRSVASAIAAELLYMNDFSDFEPRITEDEHGRFILAVHWDTEGVHITFD